MAKKKKLIERALFETRNELERITTLRNEAKNRVRDLNTRIDKVNMWIREISKLQSLLEDL